jgi:hypothetical protein
MRGSGLAFCHEIKQRLRKEINETVVIFLVLAILGGVASTVVAGQPSGVAGWGQTARPDPVALPQVRRVEIGLRRFPGRIYFDFGGWIFYP